MPKLEQTPSDQQAALPLDGTEHGGRKITKTKRRTVGPAIIGLVHALEKKKPAEQRDDSQNHE